MRTTWWVRGATYAVTGLAALMVGGRAWADANVPLRAGQAPTTAVGFPTHGCDETSGGGPYADRDVWSFLLPDSTRRFIAVTASFDTDGDSAADITLSAPQAGGIDGGSGASKAWIVAPARATLLAASAAVTGTTAPNPNFFNITRTCPASVPPSPSPQASPNPSAIATAVAIASAKPSAGVAKGRESHSLTVASSGDTVVGAGPGEAPGESISTGPPPTGAQDADGGGGIGPSGLVVGVGALLGSVACAGGLMMIRQRRYGLGRPGMGRHHRIAGSSPGRANPTP